MYKISYLLLYLIFFEFQINKIKKAAAQYEQPLLNLQIYCNENLRYQPAFFKRTATH